MLEKLQKKLKEVGLTLLEEYEIIDDAFKDICERLNKIEERLRILEEKDKRDWIFLY